MSQQRTDEAGKDPEQFRQDLDRLSAASQEIIDHCRAAIEQLERALHDGPAAPGQGEPPSTERFADGRT